MTRTLTALLSVSLVATLAGCEAKKSANPLSPSIAGPIEGVTITSPKPVAPNGEIVPVQSQPVTLLVANAASSGVRPVTYVFEVAVDAAFTNKVLSREDIPPGEGGRTGLRLPDALAPERTYYWRARAQDGANTGPFSEPARFDVITPVVIDPPGLMEPAANQILTTLLPRFKWANAGRSGPVGTIVYLLQVSATDTFATTFAWNVPEQTNQTTFDSPSSGTYSTVYYWRVRAGDGTTNGPWSVIRAFRTPDAPPPPPPPPGPPPPTPVPGHVPPGPLTEAQAEKVTYATGNEFPQLTRVFGSDSEAEAAAEELLLRTIWHLKQYGFQAGRQRNPSGAMSKDKLCIYINGVVRAFDVFRLGMAGQATQVQWLEVWPAGPVPDNGIPD
jgi:hypothetical protein